MGHLKVLLTLFVWQLVVRLLIGIKIMLRLLHNMVGLLEGRNQIVKEM